MHESWVHKSIAVRIKTYTYIHKKLLFCLHLFTNLFCKGYVPTLLNKYKISTNICSYVQMNTNTCTNMLLWQVRFLGIGVVARRKHGVCVWSTDVDTDVESASWIRTEANSLCYMKTWNEDEDDFMNVKAWGDKIEKHEWQNYRDFESYMHTHIHTDTTRIHSHTHTHTHPHTHIHTLTHTHTDTHTCACAQPHTLTHTQSLM